MNKEQIRHYVDLLDEELNKLDDATNREEMIKHEEEIYSLIDELCSYSLGDGAIFKNEINKK